MRLYGSLLIIFLLLTIGGAGSESEGFCHHMDCFADDSNDDSDEVMIVPLDVSTNSSVPPSLHSFPWTSNSCIIYNSSQLKCSWSTHTLPAEAEYSASFQLCPDENSTYPLKCLTSRERERVECLGQINASEEVQVQIRISIHPDQYIICKAFMENYIEILDPPKNISVIVNSTDLEINWLPTETINSLPYYCFEYEIKINDEVVPFNDISSKVLRYTKRNLDLTRSYCIQIRTKAVNLCVPNGLWSEWSESKVINQVEKPYHLNIYVILSIAFVLPMILLAILLVCKIQRLSEKLLPVIPSPSTKVKMLLENNDFSQVMPPKQCGCEAEEGTEILQVTG